MIQIEDNSTKVAIRIPKSVSLSCDIYNLYVISKLTNEIYTYTFEDKGTYELFYTAVLDFSDLQNGEYEYKCTGLDSDNIEIILSYGLIQIGEYEIETKEYNKEIKYKTYNG